MISFESLLKKSKKKIPNLNEEFFREVFDFARKKHDGQKRAGGEKFISHPIAVANILLDFSSDQAMIFAALLHDVAEDSDTSIDEISKKFGKEIGKLVAGMTKLSHVKACGEDRQIGSLRKMFLAMAKDIRVVLIKLADRLHNMQTLQFLSEEKQVRIARETLLIYAQIANRLGVFKLKSPLEDLAFFYLYPDEYHKISEQIIKHETYRDRIVKNAKNRIEKLFYENKIKGEVLGRVKHIYSIYKKLKRKDVDSINEIYDIFAIRIIVPKIADCYAMLGIIHKYFIPLSKRFKDYIAVPKSNGYQSIHTTVIGLSGIKNKTFPIEIQIRTPKMNEEAEFGVAAHWHYKEKGSNSPAEKSKEWISDLVEMERQFKNNKEFVQEISTDQFSDRIFALTPAGEIKDLPIGATPIDFAFSIHTDIGIRMHSAKINRKIVPLDYKIQNGEVIEIVTRKNAVPNQNWLQQCVTGRAKNRIRAFLRKKDESVLFREGKEIFNKNLVRFGLTKLDQKLSILKNYGNKNLTRKDREEILLRIGNGSISALSVLKKIITEKDKKKTKVVDSKIIKKTKKTDEPNKNSIIIEGQSGLPIKMASCCHPQSPDQIVGFVTRGNSVTIHRRDCHSLAKLDPKRFVESYFFGQKPMQKVFLEIKLVFDRIGLLHDISAIFLREQVNVLNFFFKNRHIVVGTMIFVIEINDLERLDSVISKLENISGVGSVRQIREDY